MSCRVLLSAPYMIPVIDRFGRMLADAGIELVVASVPERLDEAQLAPYAGKVDGVICGDDRLSAQVLEAFSPRLRVISKWGTGIDSIDQLAAKRLGIRVCNTPDAFTDAVADSVLGYVLAFARKIPWADRQLKAGGWAKLPGVALHECTLGVVGVGRIGKAVLQRAGAFKMRLLGNDIIAVDAAFVERNVVEITDLTSLLRRSDFISVNCDLNPSSHHLIGHEALKTVKPGAFLINTARGAVVDEAALVEALQQGRLAGAALDVYEDEPLPADSPLRRLENVLLAPHNANSSPEAWERVHVNTLRNLLVGLGIEMPSGLASGPRASGIGEQEPS